MTGKADHKGFWAKGESAGAPRSAFNSPQLTIQGSSVSNARNFSKNHHKRVLIGNRPDSGCYWLKVLKVQPTSLDLAVIISLKLPWVNGLFGIHRLPTLLSKTLGISG